MLQVLPPWGPLPHWKSKDIGEQLKLPWKKFFNVESLVKYVTVVELSDLLSGQYKQFPKINHIKFVKTVINMNFYCCDIDKKTLLVNQLIYLQHFQDGWNDEKWEEKYKFEECIKKPPYW